jgi:hypothetical protein
VLGRPPPPALDNLDHLRTHVRCRPQARAYKQ